jgi:hypothetical protein
MRVEGKRRSKAMKRGILAVLAVFVAWSVLDFIIHGLILNEAYQATQSLWRPMGEMKMYLIYVSTLAMAIVFVTIYAWFFGKRGMGRALQYGILFGLGLGISMAYGSYAVLPIPYHMALVWFLGTLVETTLGGILLGLIIRRPE